jgi:serine/threonine-protein kinase RsbW
MEGVIRAITAAMAEAGFPEREAFAVHLALEEAIVNAHRHGHRGDWSPPIAARYRVGAGGLVAQVEDQGVGFDPDQVPDPLAPENLERPSGRGLLLMRAYMKGVCHNEGGNCVCLCKHRPGPSPEAGQPTPA